MIKDRKAELRLRGPLKKRGHINYENRKHWPIKHLAVIFAMYLAYAKWPIKRTRWVHLRKMLRQYQRSIFKEYFGRTGRRLTAHIIGQRVDKAIRQGELDRYAHLVQDELSKIRRWKTGGTD